MTSTKFIQNKTALITLIAACLVVLISLGVRQTFGLFFSDFKNDLDISLTESGLAVGLQMLMWGLSGPIFGAIADKYGGHKAIMLAFIFYILGIYFLYSGPNTGIFFQIDMGLLVGIGLGGTAISIPMSIVGKHFPLSNRTIAMSLVTAVGSFGYFISPMYTSYSLINNGWIHTLYIFTIFLVIGLVIAFFVRSPSLSESIEKPSDQNTMSALKEAFKTKSYVLLTAGFFVCGFHITLVGTHVPTYVIDRGLETWTAAAILSLIGLFNIFGSLFSGYLSTKMKKKVILAAIYALRGISICLFIFLPASNINAFIFGASFGFLWLSTVPATSGIVAQMFGTKHLGMLYGIVFLSHQIGSFFGSFLGGLFHDIYGSYDYAWYLAIALSIFAAIIHVPIKEEPVLRLKTE
ncbi:MFS transporter [Candidatus Pelagibacter sp.]|nr:MFS transporter [bacterium]MDA9853694.1 MFS transporter [Candidatus Pelagibacter sp.]MDB2427728.1 MFS transporter [Candidatus Pelagibacter bacterium]MDB2678901.1 MFS transporter [Candidatus Pelagibacter bacterium]MDB3975711.1 MFS transporter [Candidatus Pelagibacter sp.]